MKNLFAVIGILIIVGVVVFVFGPRPEIDGTVTFDKKSVEGLNSDALEAWIAAKEAGTEGIIEGAEKGIVWADPQSKARTRIALVYVHGFSATRREVFPTAENVARALGANLYLTRLAGHGIDGEALATASMNQWVNDYAETIAIAEQLGDKIFVVSASTGGTLATYMAQNRDVSGRISGYVNISPNYAVQGISIGMLNMPWAETILPVMMGSTREWEPHNEQHGKWWTTSYPSAAVFPMAALLKAADETDKSKIETPALFLISPDDEVIVPGEARKVAENWGGPTQVIEITGSDDPSQHVISGEILSPSTTDQVSDTLIAWILSVAPEN